MNSFGSQQSRVLALIEMHGSYRCETAAEQNAARKLNGKGLIRRDKKDGNLWYDAAAADLAPKDEGGDGGPDAPETGVDRLPRPDPYAEAVAVVTQHAKASPSLVQRLLGIGYNLACSLIERMESEGIVGPVKADGKRDVLKQVEGDGSVDPRVKPEETGIVIARHDDASDLLATVERARRLLDDGDVIAARMLASAAYDQAKLAAQYGERFRAAEKLVGKARQLQGDALLIEARAKIRIASEWDAAEAAGQTLKGRPKSVPDENAFTAAQAGLTRKEIHDARKLAAAEERVPGIVERAIQVRLESGLEPSRASLRVAIGTRSASAEEKGDQLYETPIEAMRTLLALESFSVTVKEPAVGKGAILRPMEDAGYDVMIADLVDRGIATRHGELQQVGDFLQSVAGDSAGVDIVTNPPYAELANAFPAHALSEHKPRKMALLLNWNFAAGFEDPNRIFVMDENPPSRVYLFTRRLPMMHRDGWDGPKASSQMNTAWFVWERNQDGSYGEGFPRMIRVDWKAYENAAPLAPGAGGNVAPMTFKPQADDEFARETPRKTLDERVGEERERALEWARGQGFFDVVMLRQGIAVRPSVAEALIAEMAGAGLIVADDDGVVWTVAAHVREAAE